MRDNSSPDVNVDPEWIVNHGLSARGKQDDASYVACVELSSSA